MSVCFGEFYFCLISCACFSHLFCSFYFSKICRNSTVFTAAGFLLRFFGDSYYTFYNFFFIGLLLLLNKRFCCVPACRFLNNLLFDAVVLFHFVFGHDHSCIRKWRCVSKLFLSFVKACRICSFAMLFRVFFRLLYA